MDHKVVKFLVKVEGSVEIMAPVGEVFAFFTNPKNYEKIFAESKVKIEMLSNDPIGVGTKYRISLILGGRKVDFHTHEYIEFEKDHRLIDREIEGGLKREDMTFIFDTTEKGTKVTATIDYKLPYSVLGKVIGKLTGVETAFNRFLINGLEKSREILET